MQVNSLSKIPLLLTFMLLSLASLLLASIFGLRESLHFVYFFTWVLLLIFYWRCFVRENFIFKPTFLLISYVLLNFSFGSAIYYYEAVLDLRSLQIYYSWDYLFETAVFFILATYATAFGATFVKEAVISGGDYCFNNSSEDKISFLLVFIGMFGFLFFFLLLFFFDHELMFIPRTIVALSIIIGFWNSKLKIRWAVYFFIILALAVISVESKREAIFLILPILFLEYGIFKRNLSSCVVWKNFQHIFVFSALFFVVFLFVSSMSIMRGYGSYEVETFFEAVFFVFDYTEV